MKKYHTDTGGMGPADISVIVTHYPLLNRIMACVDIRG